MTLCVTGGGTTIVNALRPLLPVGENIIHWDNLPNPANADRFLFAQGKLTPTRARDQHGDEMLEIASANWLDVMEKTELALRCNSKARICVMGSESGFKGSFNEVYASAKAALHQYVETKRLEYPNQQLVAIAPTVIEDSGMTQKRDDLDKVLAAGERRRRGHWLSAHEVARIIKFVLYEDKGALCNVVIRVTGGNY